MGLTELPASRSSELSEAAREEDPRVEAGFNSESPCSASRLEVGIAGRRNVFERPGRELPSLADVRYRFAGGCSEGCAVALRRLATNCDFEPVGES